MIQTVEKQYDSYSNEFSNYKVTYENGEIWYVTHDTANRHYQEILEWVAEGNTITDNGGGE
jgi:hypothetical protein